MIHTVILGKNEDDGSLNIEVQHGDPSEPWQWELQRDGVTIARDTENATTSLVTALESPPSGKYVARARARRAAVWLDTPPLSV